MRDDREIWVVWMQHLEDLIWKTQRLKAEF